MKNKNMYIYAGLLATFVAVAFGAPTNPGAYGAWSLIPPVVMFAFILLTQKVLEGFVWGGLLAVFMKYKWSFLLTYNEKLLKQVTTEGNLWLILVLLTIGSIVAILDKSGLSRQFGLWAGSKAKSGKMALIINYVMGFFLSFDLYLSSSTVGTCMTPVNDKYKTPREKTAYVTLSTAITLTHLYPIGTGAIFIAGLLVTNGYAAEGEGIQAFTGLVPLLFFPLAFLLVTLLNVIGVLPDIGSMKQAYAKRDDAELKAASHTTEHEPEQAEGQAAAEQASDRSQGDFAGKRSPHLLYFFLPIVIFIVSTIYFKSNTQLGAFITILATGVIYVARGIFTAETYIATVLDGMKNMLELAVIMATAFVLADSITDIGFTNYVVGIVSVFVIPKWLPFIIFLVFSATEFLVTLNWSLYIMAIPVLLQLSASVGANTPLTLAALLSAGIWGASTCITSDIGLLTAYSTKTTVYRHFKTKLPYSLMAFVLSAIAYLIGGLFF